MKSELITLIFEGFGSIKVADYALRLAKSKQLNKALSSLEADDFEKAIDCVEDLIDLLKIIEFTIGQDVEGLQNLLQECIGNAE